MRVLIIDDHQLFIDGIRYIVKRLDEDVDVLEAASASEAFRCLDSEIELDLVLLDLHMPGMNGMSIMQHRRVQECSLPVVIISGEDDPRIIKSAISSGAMGFIPKAYSGQELLAALRSILSGELFVPDGIRFRQELPASGIARDEDIPCAGITRRQHEVLKLLASGYSNKQISSKLFLTENTVKAHVSALLRTCGASNRTECVNIARQIGII